jgi:hypothetical protein
LKGHDYGLIFTTAPDTSTPRKDNEMHKLALLAAAAIVTGMLAASANDVSGNQAMPSSKLDPSNVESAMSASAWAIRAMRSNDMGFARLGGGGQSRTTPTTKHTISVLGDMRNSAVMAVPGSEAINRPIEP